MLREPAVVRAGAETGRNSPLSPRREAETVNAVPFPRVSRAEGPLRTETGWYRVS